MLETWQDLEREWRERPPLEVRLEDYDALLDSGEEDERQDEAGEAVPAKGVVDAVEVPQIVDAINVVEVVEVVAVTEAYHFEEVPA